jgi:tyrosyl-tRNA synthetase
VHIIDDFSKRGLVYQLTDEAKLKEWLDTPGRSMYCGFDPTAPSLHIGNMVPLISLLRFQKAGHKPIVLMGGATGLIGDPSGKDKERKLLTKENIDASIAKIEAQAANVFQRAGGEAPIVVNNYDWTKEISAIGLLRDIGKHFTVNHMMGKESVKNRIDRDEVGISYTEFSYMILQALDFAELYEKKDCRLQIGGSDQWGNITAGTELIRKKLAGEAYALTFPLITTASGAKFGKSEKGAIYLDPAMTTPYDYYQYWVNTDDRDVVSFLNYFTFLSHDEIAGLAESVEKEPHLREAQKRLAQEMTVMVHGQEEVDKILSACDVLFGKGEISGVDAGTLRSACISAPTTEYAQGNVPGVADILVDLGFVKSKGQAKKDIAAGAVKLNNMKVDDFAYVPSSEDFSDGQVALLKKGKKNYGLIVVKS